MSLRWKHELQDLPPEQGAKRHYFTFNDGDKLLLHAIYQSGDGRGDRVHFELPDGKIHSVALPKREADIEGVKAAVEQIIGMTGDRHQQGAALFMMASVCKLQSTQYGLEFEIPIPAKPNESDIRNLIRDPFMMAASSAFADYAAARINNQPLPEKRKFILPKKSEAGHDGYLWRHKIMSACRNWGSKLHWFEFSPANDPSYGLIGFSYASGADTGSKLTIRTSDTILDEPHFPPQNKTIDLIKGWQGDPVTESKLKFRNAERLGSKLIHITHVIPEENVVGYPKHAGQYMGLIMLASLYNLLSTRFDKPFDWIDLPKVPTGKSLQQVMEDKDMTHASQMAGKIAASTMSKAIEPIVEGMSILIEKKGRHENTGPG